jgi:hypothetical protein
MTTSRTTRYGNREICTGDWEKANRILVRKRKEEEQLEGVGVSGRTNVN